MPTLIPVAHDDPRLDRLLQLYMHEWSALVATPIDADARYRYPDLPHWEDRVDHAAYLVVADAAPQGFALIARDPASGYVFAAIVTVVTEAVLVLPFVSILRREQALPNVLALAWRPALAALAMGAAMLLVYNLGPQGLLAAVVAAPVYLAALWALGAFGAEERALVRRVLGRA